METSQQDWRLAIAGAGHRGNFYRERWQLLNPGRVVAHAADQPKISGSSLPVVSLRDLPARSHGCTAVLVTIPAAERGTLVAECLSARLSVLVEPPLAQTLAEAQSLFELAQSNGVTLRMIGMRRSEPDYLAASAAVNSGRLGSLTALRWYTSEYAVWGGDAATDYRRGESLTAAGPAIFDQLAGLTGAVPLAVTARDFPAEDGFTADIDFDDGTTACIELRRAARVTLRTGWMIEGNHGSYHHRRIITTTADGELVDEAVPLPAPPLDPLAELEAMKVLTPMSGDERRRCLTTTGLMQAARLSIAVGEAVAWKRL